VSWQRKVFRVSRRLGLKMADILHKLDGNDPRKNGKEDDCGQPLPDEAPRGRKEEEGDQRTDEDGGTSSRRTRWNANRRGASHHFESGNEHEQQITKPVKFPRCLELIIDRSYMSTSIPNLLFSPSVRPTVAVPAAHDRSAPLYLIYLSFSPPNPSHFPLFSSLFQRNRYL
jgi:hypothetical protein